MDESWLPVSDAAKRLARSPSHVRSMLESGALGGRKLGHAWFVDPEDVLRRSAHGRPAGRPLSAANAWRYLRALDLVSPRPQALGDELAAEQAPPALRLPDMNAVDRSRLRAHLGQIPDVEGLACLVQSRAVVRRVRVHPGVLEPLLGDKSVSVGAAHAVAARGGGIAAAGRPRVYAREAEIDPLLARYRLVDDIEGNLDLAVIPAHAAAAVLPERGRPVWLAAAWIDLLDAPDSRARAAARLWVDDLPGAVVVLDGRRRQ